ncbi:MAG: PTS sugar transporter subunit IIA [Spirochaetales bacterium]|nr:PTS sugar transporter subunit IIA [Spirochaetales bacterium]
MDFRSMITEQRICLLKEKKKKPVLLKLIDCAVKQGAVREQDAGALTERIFHREKLMSTGIGIGIAIPHVRFAGVKNPLIIVGIQPEGIADYMSIDDRPVQVVVMILMAQNQHREYIALLSNVVAFLKSDAVKQKLIKTETAAAAYKLITGKSKSAAGRPAKDTRYA